MAALVLPRYFIARPSEQHQMRWKLLLQTGGHTKRTRSALINFSAISRSYPDVRQKSGLRVDSLPACESMRLCCHRQSCGRARSCSDDGNAVYYMFK